MKEDYSMNIADEKILITGINDMIGLSMLSTLKQMGATVVRIGDIHEDIGSLSYLESEILRFKPSIVFHIPGDRHGIAVHQNSPGNIYYESVVIFAHLLEASRHAGVKKIINVLSNCVYPEKINVPYKENEIWEGLPEKTLIPHGLARRVSIVHSNAYRAQYGINTISIVLASVYGPNDNFNPKSSQVMASMIQRFVEATDNKLDKVVSWGTGRPKREFIHVNDAVHGLLMSSIYYNEEAPLNIGTQQEYSIKEVTEIVAKCAGFLGEIEWDTTKPDGRERVCLDCSRMKSLLPPWENQSLETGIQDTIEWFRKLKKIVVM